MLKIKKIAFILSAFFFFLKRETRGFFQWNFFSSVSSISSMEIPFLPHPSPLPSFSRNPTFLLSNSSQTDLALLFFSSIFLRKLFSFIPLLDSHFILEIERFILFLLFLSFFLRRNVSLHTTRFRIISLLKFYFFFSFFFLSRNILLSRLLQKPSSIFLSLTKFFVRILFTPFLHHSSFLKKILVYR